MVACVTTQVTEIDGPPGLSHSQLERWLERSVIAAGIHARYLRGKTVGAGFEVFGAMVDRTLQAAHSQLGGI
jgi:hypothetical protein